MKIAAGLFALTLATGFAVAQDNYSTWGSMRVLTVNHSGITAGVGKFPLLVRLTSAHADVFTNSKGRGADIRFTNAALTTRYKHQIERWDSAGQKAEIWVLLDTVRTNANTSVKMLWNKVGAIDSSRASAVFDTTNGYVSVWHLGDSTGANPRPNAIPGAPTAILKNFGMATTEDPTPLAYTPKEGVIGFADSLRGGAGDNLQGTKDFIDLNRRGYQGFSNFNTGFTFSAWIYSNGPLFAERFIELLDDTTSSASSDTRIILFGNRTDPVPNGVSVRWGAGGTYNSPNENLYTGNEWYHFIFTKPAGNAPMTIYTNGVARDVTPELPDLAVGLRNYVYLGRSSVTASDPYFQGKFDEVRISKRARSAAWAKLSYETQKPGATAVTVSATTAPAAGGNDFTGIVDGRLRSLQGFSARGAGQQVLFRLPSEAAGRVSIVDLYGRTVWSSTVDAGTSELAWDGRGSKGTLARGVYMARFAAKGAGPVLEHKFTFNP